MSNIYQSFGVYFTDETTSIDFMSFLKYYNKKVFTTS